MITIIPSLEVMKAVTDNNISSSGADLRRQAFDKATDLMTLGNVEVLIEGLVYERVENKLIDEHKVIFQSGYRIDNSAKGLTQYGTTQAVKFVAESESKSRKVIILTENPDDFKSICNGSIITLTPSFFIEKVTRAINNYHKKIISNIDDSLNALFFL
jgi:hypothetical protein